MRALPARHDRRAAPGRPPQAGEQHGRHEQERQHEARNEAREIELRDRGLGHGAVDDHVDRRRDQDAERAAGRDRAEEEPLVVVVLLDLAHRDGADRDGGRDARSGRRAPHRAGDHVGMHQPAGQPRDPLGDRRIHALRHAGAQHDLAHQHVERHRDEDERRGGRPGHFAGGHDQRDRRIELVEHQAEPAEAGRDRHGEHQDEQQDQDGDERSSVGLARREPEAFLLELHFLLDRACAEQFADAPQVALARRRAWRAADRRTRPAGTPRSPRTRPPAESRAARRARKSNACSIRSTAPAPSRHRRSRTARK